jgi:asparagine synthase (glutamine-hydrolysing)
MCGIFAALTNINCLKLFDHFNKIAHRGPDATRIFTIPNSEMKMGFHRLAINDLSDHGMQPFELNNAWLICNGEIFNHKELEQKYQFKMKSLSDCEIILHLYNYHGRGKDAIARILKEIEGEFAFVLYDNIHKDIYVARDEFGIRPLFYSLSKNTAFFASEMKALSFCSDVRPFPPAHFLCHDYFSQKIEIHNLVKYYEIPRYNGQGYNINEVYNNIRYLLESSVDLKLMSERPIGAFLSGGVDSSLICALLIKKLPNLHVFSIGLDENSFDIIAAKKVAKHIGVKPGHHHCIYYTVEEGFSALKEVIYHLETWDITSIRASIPQYLLSKYIAKNTDIKVLYSGELSDEAFASYQYFKHAPNGKELELESKKLLEEIYLYDALRVDRTVTTFGLECRIPFASKKLIDYIFSLPPELRMCYDRIEKSLLRNSFKNTGILQDEIIFRKKDAFSDAVSSKEKSWYKSLQLLIETLVSDNDLLNASEKYPNNTPRTKEALYYRNIFTELFPNRDDIIPHYWMPNWVETDDPSATVLKVYENSNE